MSAYRRVDPRLRSTYLATPATAGGKHLIVDPRIWIWISSPKKDGEGVALRTRIEEKPFDLGWTGNLGAALKDGWLSWTLLPWSVVTCRLEQSLHPLIWQLACSNRRRPGVTNRPLRLNPAVLRRLEYEASLLALDLKGSSDGDSEDAAELEGDASNEAG